MSFGCTGSLLLHGLSLVVVSGGYAQAAVCGLLIVKASLAVVLGLQGTQAPVVVVHGLSSGAWALECRLNSCGA